MVIFGLAYNMIDKTGIEYPILATNWTSVSWTSHANTTSERAAAECKDTTLKVV